MVDVIKTFTHAHTLQIQSHTYTHLIAKHTPSILSYAIHLDMQYMKNHVSTMGPYLCSMVSYARPRSSIGADEDEEDQGLVGVGPTFRHQIPELLVGTMNNLKPRLKVRKKLIM